MSLRSYQRSFVGGEISPEMLSRIDDGKYVLGYARGRNLVISPTGAAKRRGGLEHIAIAPHDATIARLFPFRVSSSEAYVMMWGDTWARFFRSGAAYLYATPRTVASYNTTAETITFTEPHGFANEDAIRFTHKGTYPSWIASTGVYYVTVVNPLTIQISLTTPAGSPVNITGSTAIDETQAWLVSELPRVYVPTVAVSAVNLSPTNTFTTVAPHHLVTGDPVQFTTTGSLPTGDAGSFGPALLSAYNYYVIVTSTTAFKIAATKALALAGTFITLTGPGSGTHTVHYYYVNGTLVYWEGAIGAGTSARVFWCKDTGQLNNTPGNTAWHQQPSSGAYEVYLGGIEDYIFEIRYDQSSDAFTSTHKNFATPFEFRRELMEFPSGSNATADVFNWTTRGTSFAPTLSAPTNLDVTETYGKVVQMVADNTGSGPFTSLKTPGSGSTQVRHGYGLGDIVWVSLHIDGTGALAGIGPGAFVVEPGYDSGGSNSATALRVKVPSTGAYATFSSAITGYVRATTLDASNTEVYAVTAVDEHGNQSRPSVELTVTNQLAVQGSKNVLTWSAVTGATRYRIYKKQSGVLGVIGITDTTTFTDDGIGPDLSASAPYFDATISDSPVTATAHFEQRRVFAYGQSVWMTASGSEADMSYHLPQLDSDRIKFDFPSDQNEKVQHVVEASGQLFLLTDTSEIRVTPQNSDAITPSSVSTRRQSGGVGANHVRPNLFGSSLLFTAASGGHVFELGYRAEIGAFKPVDMCLRTSHLFDGLNIVDSAQMRSPYPIDWRVSSSGDLLGLTYASDESVSSWHVHDTDGTFRSVCCIVEDGEDRLYALVERTIDGEQALCLERMARLTVPDELEDCTYLDSFLTYDGAAATSITGLDHLEGETVYALAGGVVEGPFTVTSGAITLSTAATPVHVGRAYEPLLRPLPLVFQVDGYGKGRQWNPKKVFLQVVKSASFEARPYNAGIPESQRADWQPVYLTRGDHADLMPDDEITEAATVYVDAEGGWQVDGQVEIRQPNPFPLNVLSMTIEVEVGGG